MDLLLRCRLDGLLLVARFVRGDRIEVDDSGESFVLEAAEAAYYEMVAARPGDWTRARSTYRLLRPAGDVTPVGLAK